MADRSLVIRIREIADDFPSWRSCTLTGAAPPDSARRRQRQPGRLALVAGPAPMAARRGSTSFPPPKTCQRQDASPITVRMGRDRGGVPARARARSATRCDRVVRIVCGVPTRAGAIRELFLIAYLIARRPHAHGNDVRVRDIRQSNSRQAEVLLRYRSPSRSLSSTPSSSAAHTIWFTLQLPSCSASSARPAPIRKPARKCRRWATSGGHERLVVAQLPGLLHEHLARVREMNFEVGPPPPVDPMVELLAETLADRGPHRVTALTK